MNAQHRELAQELAELLVKGLAIMQTEEKFAQLVESLGKLSTPQLISWRRELKELEEQHGVSTSHATPFTNRCGSLFRLATS